MTHSDFGALVARMDRLEEESAVLAAEIVALEEEVRDLLRDLAEEEPA